MKKLKISNFKAFGDKPVVFGGETKEGAPMNILCYGENGSGKSSAYEAIKYIFHKERIENEKIPAHLQGSALNNAKMQILIDYKNRKTSAQPVILINDVPFETFDKSNYYVYMLTGDDLAVNKHIDVNKLLKSVYLAKHNIDADLTDEVLNCILEEVNRSLKTFFFEDVTISSSQNAAYRILLTDEKQNLSSDDNLGVLFNEARLHLVSLLLILETVQIMSPYKKEFKKILVLDDIVTSLDMANRMFLYQYLIKKFSLYQIVLFTHNTSFYNLCDHFLKDKALDSHWLRQGIFEYNHSHIVYSKSADRISTIKTELSEHPEQVHNIGNEVRQYFEVLVHQYAMLLMAGAKEDLASLLGDIQKKCEAREFHISESGVENLHDLFKSINNVLHNIPEERQLQSIKRAIDRFNNATEGVDKLAENLQAMTIYQKVALHQSSHGHEGLPDLTEKEIRASLHVLSKMEKTLKDMKIERI